MSKYGIPYQGSKSKIADDILEVLPSGKRLVDLFGGGFAITHCALLNHADKWDRFLYNDINPLLQPLIESAIRGDYNYNKFTPEWISRERFYKEKANDGYIKWIWSFGNNGKNYLFGKDIEPIEKAIHQLVVFEEESELTKGVHLEGNTIEERRLSLRKWCRERGDLQQLERLQRLQQLERLQRLQQLQQLQQLEQLEQLEMSNIDYRGYQHQVGDVVYCDVPYPDSKSRTTDYGGGFDFSAFVAWAKNQPYDVYYSSYSGENPVWTKQVRSVMNSGKGGVARTEGLYKI